ncbi:hypothetical protein DID88_001622 [Monilinia fructigena]|uniref:Zn(2)-C6 fungal-type domain-containing protein n=1 Tax=Monilinia fructigena TaxID=38457 RepID=A0A395IWA7_9HELO|nr:hypothetical protein DID88_001622 [Monilinia fructigena]
MGPKSKTRCLTCRIRRVKCGEEKPECHRCTKTGRKCDGYDPDRPEMSSTAQSEKASAASSPSLSPITSHTTSIITMPSSSINGNEQEQRSFHFFINKTAPELAGFCESKFWTSLVLQRCHSDHSIRHAIIALGAYRESFKFGDIKLLEGESIDYPKQRFALIQNNKAIRHLKGHLSHGGYTQTPEVILISCLLFICFEAMQGNYQAAFDHLNSGLKILNDWMERNYHNLETNPEPSLAQEFICLELIPLFSALDIQAMTAHGILRYHQSAAQQRSRIAKETEYNPHPDSVEAIMDEKRKLVLQLEQWFRAFNAFAQVACQNMDTNGLRACKSLKLHYIANKLLLGTALLQSEMDYDQYIDQFQLMNSLAESLLNSYGDSIADDGRVLSFDAVIVPPLLWVACKCRDPSVHRKAYAFLSSSCRREGGWDSDYASCIGKWTIDKEEEGLEDISSAEKVLESNRIVVVRISSLGRRKALVKFTQGPCRDGGSAELKEECIVW